MMRANRPSHVQYNMDDDSISVCSVSGTAQKDLRVRIELRDDTWLVEHAEELHVNVAPDHSEKVADLDLSGAKSHEMSYLQLSLFDAAGHEIDRNFYLLPGARGLEPVRTIVPVKLDVSVDPLREEHGETVAVVRLQNQAAQPALMVIPSILKSAEGDEILPTFWDDRCVEVAPGETRQFTARWADDRQGAADPYLVVEGWNVLPVEVNLRDGKPVDLHLQIQRSGKVDDLKAGQVERVPFTVTETAPAGSGSRVTTWPVRVQVGDGPARTIRVGAINGKSRQVGVPVVFPHAGTQAVTLGGQPAFELAVGDPWPVRSQGAVAYIDGGGAGIDSLGFKLTDSDPETSWSATTPKKWAFLDMGTEKNVQSVTLEWGVSFVSHYQIQTSGDAVNWQTVGEKSDGKSGSDTITFAPVTTRYVRFNGLENADGKGFELREMTVR